jgi:hypothetical protein
MWNYPKSALHQAAIDAMKPELDIAAAKAMAAQSKLRRASDAVQALKEHEAEKIATRAKTARLRAERLARAAEVQSPSLAKSARK